MSINDDIIKQFDISGRLINAELYGEGHINDTYRVTMDDEGNISTYILQKINSRVFPDINGLMDNIIGVTNYIKDKIIKEGGDASRTLNVILTKEGKKYYKDEFNNYYRCLNYIRDAVTIETRPTPHQLYLSGVGFGKFQKYLDGYPAGLLKEPIKDFHNTKDRLDKLLIAAKEDNKGRLESVLPELSFFLDRASYSSKIIDLIESGDIPIRVTHNDTKLNNMMIDLIEDKAVTAIDLDTVMPGSIIYDFGDSIRSGANIGAEDEQDLEKVGFSLELFEAFCKGFLTEVKDILTPAERENMAFGAILMTYECGMRFLTDHLNGDTYFKIHRENHNLDRARTQIKLVKDMEKVLNIMNDIVCKYAG